MRTLEFESRLLEDGHLYCPEEVLQQVAHSEKVIVRIIPIFEETPPEEKVDVTEEEIRQIMEMPGVNREDVLALLSAAGTFSDDEEYEERMRQIREGGNRWRTIEWS